MTLKKPFALLTFTLGLAVIGAAHADSQEEPTAAQVVSAQDTADLMTNTVVAALVQEIGETTPENAAQGSRSISLIFNDRNDDMRLVGTVDPLRENDRPADAFEEQALASAMGGVPSESVERVHGKWTYRRSIPLSNFAPQCAMCHANFAALAPTDMVGALMLRVPIEGE